MRVWRIIHGASMLLPLKSNIEQMAKCFSKRFFFPNIIDLSIALCIQTRKSTTLFIYIDHSHCGNCAENNNACGFSTVNSHSFFAFSNENLIPNQ